MDIEINKLRRTLMYGEENAAVNQINEVFSMINIFNKYLMEDNKKLNSEIQTLEDSMYK